MNKPKKDGMTYEQIRDELISNGFVQSERYEDYFFKRMSAYVTLVLDIKYGLFWMERASKYKPSETL